MAFHAKMIFFPMITTMVTMVVFCCCVYSLVLRYGDCSIDILHVLDGTGHLTFEAFGFDQLGEFATWTIRLSIIISPLIVVGLGVLSYMHFVAWGNLAESWEKTRQMFASFEGDNSAAGQSASASMSMFDVGGMSDENGVGDQVLFELKALAYVFYVNYFMQLMLFWACIWKARTELKETHILYTMMIIGAFTLGYQGSMAVTHRNAHKAALEGLGMGRTATQRGARWHGRMLFYPCLVLMVLTFVYMATGFALFHYYRDPSWIPDQTANITNATSLTADIWVRMVK